MHGTQPKPHARTSDSGGANENPQKLRSWLPTRRLLTRRGWWAYPQEALQGIEVNQADGFARVGAGVRKLQLNEVLRPLGLLFGPDPSSNPCLGGMASTGGSGMSTPMYGTMKENGAGPTRMLGTGERAQTQPGRAFGMPPAARGKSTLSHTAVGAGSAGADGGDGGGRDRGDTPRRAQELHRVRWEEGGGREKWSQGISRQHHQAVPTPSCSGVEACER